MTKRPEGKAGESHISDESLTELEQQLRKLGLAETEVSDILSKLIADNAGQRPEDTDLEFVFRLAAENLGYELTDLEKAEIKANTIQQMKAKYKQLGLDEYGRLKKQ